MLLTEQSQIMRGPSHSTEVPKLIYTKYQTYLRTRY